jgi:DNA adenine methylase
MQYLGGKSRLGKQIAYVINRIRRPGQPYWEPFCGSCWVTIHVHKSGPRYCSDGCFELIEMWRELQNGWIPPKVVTEEMYQAAKSGEYSPAMRAFIGFGCSFGGKWFAGYARQASGYNFAKGAGRFALQKAGELQDVLFTNCGYHVAPPDKHLLIYADPPYAGTTGYSAVKFPFSTVEFWQQVRKWAYDGHTVIVSEYAAPDDFECIVEMPTATEIRTADNGRESRTERLFMHKSQAHLYDAVPRQLDMFEVKR